MHLFQKLCLVKFRIIKMTIHTLDSTLQELLIQAGKIQFFRFKDQLFLEILHRPLTTAKQVTDTGMKHTQIERLTNETISTRFISFYTIFFLILGGQ